MKKMRQAPKKRKPIAGELSRERKLSNFARSIVSRMDRQADDPLNGSEAVDILHNCAELARDILAMPIASSTPVQQPESLGTIYPKATLFFRQHVGEAKEGKRKYDLATNMGGSTPIVESEKTGKWFCLGWQDIIAMAVQAGIDKED